jgi:hypothetical protein
MNFSICRLIQRYYLADLIVFNVRFSLIVDLVALQAVRFVPKADITGYQKLGHGSKKITTR